MSVKRGEDGRWRYRVRVTLPGGQSVRLTGSAPKLANTQAAAIGAERAHIARALAQPVSAMKGGMPTLRSWAENYMKVVAPTQSPSEQLSKRRKLEKVILPALGELRLDQVGRGELDGLKVRLEGMAPSTVNNYLTVVGALLAYAVDCDVLPRAPKIGMLKLAAQPFEVYSEAELEQLLADHAGDVMMTTALLLGADAGLRAGEIRALHRADVVGEGIQVVRSDYEGELKGTKSGRARVVKMTCRLATAVGGALRAHLGPRVLARPDGSPWTKESMAWCAPPKGWHALRHAFCTRLAAAGVPADRIRKLAGHASITTTQRYMHAAPAELDDAVDVLDRGQKPGKRPAASEGGEGA